MTISCPSCGDPCPARKRKCEKCRREDELAQVFRESDEQLAKDVAPTDLKLVEALPVGAPDELPATETPENPLTEAEKAALETLLAQEVRLLGTRARNRKPMTREFISSFCLEQAMPKMLAQIADVYEAKGRPEFDSRQGITATLSIAEHFMVAQTNKEIQAETWKGEPAIFAKGVAPETSAEAALLSLFKHLPEIIQGCRPEALYSFEITLKWAWPTGNQFTPEQAKAAVERNDPKSALAPKPTVH